MTKRYFSKREKICIVTGLLLGIAGAVLVSSAYWLETELDLPAMIGFVIFVSGMLVMNLPEPQKAKEKQIKSGLRPEASGRAECLTGFGVRGRCRIAVYADRMELECGGRAQKIPMNEITAVQAMESSRLAESRTLPAPVQSALDAMKKEEREKKLRKTALIVCTQNDAALFTADSVWMFAKAFEKWLPSGCIMPKAVPEKENFSDAPEKTVLHPEIALTDQAVRREKERKFWKGIAAVMTAAVLAMLVYRGAQGLEVYRMKQADDARMENLMRISELEQQRDALQEQLEQYKPQK